MEGKVAWYGVSPLAGGAVVLRAFNLNLFIIIRYDRNSIFRPRPKLD